MSRGGRADFDFVGKAAQEGRVHQVFGLEVGGEDDQFLEGNEEAFAGMEVEVVDAVFQGDDPAVEQVAWG